METLVHPERSRLLRLLADAMPGLVSYIDRKLVYHFLNERYRDWFGINPADYVGRSVADVLGAVNFQLARPHLVKGLTGPHIYEIEVQSRLGVVRSVRGYLVPDRDAAGNTLGMFSLSLDVSGEKRAIRLLEAARDDANRASAVKTRFLASATHDLRQPIHALSLFTSALARRIKDPEVLVLVDNMRATIGSLTRMFNTLLDLSKLDAGLVPTELQDVPLSEIFKQIEPEFRAQAGERGLRFTMRPTRAIVRSDPVLLESILRNLIGNAIKFTARGRVLIGVRRSGQGCSLQVHDTGPGISPERLSAIFEEYERSTQAAHGLNDGLGLGLSIVQRLSHLLGHTITVRSRLGRGTCFAIELPPNATSEESDDWRAPSRLPPGRIEGATILIVDDDPQILSALKIELLDAGAFPSMAMRPGGAFDYIAAHGMPNLMILDLQLDGASGFSVLDEIELRFGRRPRTLIVTGSTDGESLLQLKELGLRWLPKPLDPARLRYEISDMLADG